MVFCIISIIGIKCIYIKTARKCPGISVDKSEYKFIQPHMDQLKSYDQRGRNIALLVLGRKFLYWLFEITKNN